MKDCGLNLEASYLRCRYKLRKFVALVSLAYARCRRVGTLANQLKLIARKKHGYRATSLSGHDLNILHPLTRPGPCPQPLTRLVECLVD